MKAYLEGGEAAVEALNWRRGRPTKNLWFKQSEIDVMVSRATLNRQVNMSLAARAKEFSLRFKKPLKAWQLRDFYKGRGITKQVARPRLGPENLGTAEEQQQRIRQLQEDVQEALEEDLELLCIDECVFNSKGQKRSAWAPSGRPPEWDKRFYAGGYVAVCGATSVNGGLVHYKCLENKAFTTKTFMQFLRALRNKQRKPFAILMDNASYHGKEGGTVDTYCRRNEITIIVNVSYRPDFNGIEGFWAAAKTKFR